jgi:hypothetical protein
MHSSRPPEPGSGVMEDVIDFDSVSTMCSDGLLARIMHEPSAATADLAVLPGVLGSRTLRRTEQVRLRSESRGAAGWLPGGTTISPILRRRLVHNAG